MKKSVKLEFEEVLIKDLSEERRRLLDEAEEATPQAYAPYSGFHVGAAIQLDDGKMLRGSNKENASFPAGTCAERNVLNYANDHFPNQRILRMAILARTENFELNRVLAPCGICRQVICEVEQMQQSSIEIIMLGQNDHVLIVQSGQDLLPFHFYVPQLKK